MPVLNLYNSISAKVIRRGHNVPSNSSQEDLDIKCLQILRALVHNEERKLPDDWATQTAENNIKRLAFCILWQKKEEI